MRLIDKIISYVYTRYFFGPRCLGFDEDCPCCEAWQIHDDYT